MVFIRRTQLLRYLLLAAMLALLLFLTSVWLPQSESKCDGQPCWSHPTAEPPLVPGGWAWPDGAPPPLQDCPGQSFQVWRLLLHLRSSLSEDGDVLLDSYLQAWDQLLSFMESLGAVVTLFSQKVKEKVDLVRELSLARHAKHHGTSSRGGVYRSLRSMVEAELREGVVSFSRRSASGCRTLLRLHRSLRWLQLLLQGLARGPDARGRYRTPGELSREAYQVALAPHHPWLLRQAAELVFLALPDRHHFLRLVCVRDQQEATPTLRVIISALTLVHARTQQILAEFDMLELP